MILFTKLSYLTLLNGSLFGFAFPTQAKPPLQKAPTFKLSGEIFKNSDLEFKKYSGQGPFDTYLAMNIKVLPALDLIGQIESKYSIKLQSRGEAHITVITPPEYQKLSEGGLISIEEINALAQTAKIQSSEFSILCLGEGSVEVEMKVERTYFVVVQSPELLKLRHHVYDLFKSRGGTIEQFDPDHFYPHITVGYTKDDLHEKDGVIKDVSSCMGRFEIF